MLPSKGSFKLINCPFYDSGLCERPYCHFRHIKTNPRPPAAPCDDIQRLLMMQAIKETPLTHMPSSSGLETLVHNLIPHITEELPLRATPKVTPAQPFYGIPPYHPTPIADLNVYNPTPIPQLKKKHIPVACTNLNVCSTVQRKRRLTDSLLEIDLCQKRIRPRQSPKSTLALSTAPPFSWSQDYEDIYVPRSKGITSVHQVVDNAAMNTATVCKYQVKNKKFYLSNTSETSNAMLDLEENKIMQTVHQKHDKVTSDDINSNNFTRNATKPLGLEINIIQEQNKSVNFVKHTLTDVYAGYQQIEAVTSKLHCFDASTSSSEHDRGTNTQATGSEGIKIHSNHTQPCSSESLFEDKELKHKNHKRRDGKSHKDRSGSSTTTHSKKHISSKSETSSNSKDDRHKSSSSKNKHKSGHMSPRCAPYNNVRDRVRTESTRVVDKDVLDTDSKDSYLDVETEEGCNRLFKGVVKHGLDTDSKDSYLDVETEEGCNRLFKGVDKHGLDTDSKDSDLDVETFEEDYYRTFNELKVAVVSQAISPRTVELLNEMPRVAHEAAHGIQVTPHSPKRPVVNTAHMVAKQNGIAKKKLVQNKQESRLSEDWFKTRGSSKMDMPAGSSSNAKRKIPATTNSKTVRISHVPNVGKILDEKARINKDNEMRKQMIEERKQRKAEAMNRHDEYVREFTLARTAPKGTTRVAHIPTLELLEKPIIFSEVAGKKIPTSVRQTKLNLLIDEYLVFCSKQESHKLAEEREKSFYTRSNNLSTYKSLVASAILNLRKSISSKARYLPDGVACVGSPCLEYSRIKPHRELPPVYLQLRKFILTKEQLLENGFPRQDPTQAGSAVVKLRYDKDGPVSLFKRQCTRCKNPYEVDAEGLQVSKQTCEYHEGRIYNGQYRCCNEGFESPGCCGAPKHVCSNFQLTNFGFQKTLPPYERLENGDYGVYAIDCEMCYTTLGFELIRVTVVDHTLQIVMDKFVRPESPIVDYNTKFSGVSEGHLVGVDTTIHQIQESLMAFINEKTILVGHSLDCDLRALKLIHNTVVDTSVVFPHTVATKKRALKTLATTILRKTIQQGDDGHDSAEDAITAMELMLHKICY